MNQKLIISIMFIGILLASLVLAQEEYTLRVTLEQADSNKEVKNVLTAITILDREKNTEKTISTFVRNNPAILSLPKGTYHLTWRIDDLQTPGKDFYGEQEIVLDKNVDKEVMLFPVGSVKGVVYDKLNNLVSKAALKVECSRDYGEKSPLQTDKVGSFALVYAPIGECTLTATAHDAAGTTKITIDQGSSQNIEIRLDKPVIGEQNNGAALIVILFIILVLAGIALLIWKPWKQKQHAHHATVHHPEAEEKPEEIQQQKMGKRTTDILNTLNEKEKKVVQFLLDNHEESTQAKIRYGTAIPKTSLARIFVGLQNKRIITIESFGKLKKIKLTVWFLEREDNGENRK